VCSESNIFALSNKAYLGWITFAVSGIMQALLLVICIAWKYRQRRLGIDDFGHPLPTASNILSTASSDTDEVPGLVLGGDEDAAAVREALEDALESAVEEDVRSMGVHTETTPLLSPTTTATNTEEKGWFSRFVHR